MIRAILVAAAILAPFFFPWPYAALLAFVAALYFPMLGLFLGVFFDFLYYTPGAAHFPHATVFGACGALIAFVVRRFIKTRIIGA
jgi:hypothetical protein